MEYVKIGKIVNTHGIKGELRIKSDFIKKDKVFIPGNKLYIGNEYLEEEITSYRKHKEFDMVTFKGYDNINQVLKYLKMSVYIDRDLLDLKDKEYLLEDLIGMKVIENDENIGIINDFVYNNGNILLVVLGTKQFYIPYKGNYITDIDLQKKEIYTKNTKDLII